MARNAPRKTMSLKWLELFQIAAEKGSLQTVSDETGLTVSTISHHLRNLEDHLGVPLFDHTRRPMVLTAKGRAFLRNIDGALHAIRKAQAEASSGEVAEAASLRIGTIEDFDSDITPELAVFLSSAMPNCDFLYHTDASHAILEMLRDRHLDLGVTSQPTERLRDVQDRPLLRDPYVVVLPARLDLDLMDVIEGRSALPFLRFSSNLMMARQIEAQLRRIGVTPPARFECGNNQTLMAMVAAGAGWSITTPLLYARARRFRPALRMHRFPKQSFARTLALVSTPDCARSVLELVEGQMRELITRHAIDPLVADAPWLAESFALIE